MIYAKKSSSSVTALLLISGLLLGYQSAHARTMRVAATAALSLCGGATSFMMGWGLMDDILWNDQDNQMSLLARCQTGGILLAGVFTLYDAIEIVRGRNEHVKREGSLVWTTTRMIASLVTLYKSIPSIFNKEKIFADAMANLLAHILRGMITGCGIYSLCKSFQESKQLYTQYINLNKDVQHDICKEK